MEIGHVSFSLFSLGVVSAIHIFLGVVVFFSNRSSKTSLLFLALNISIVIYSVFSFLTENLVDINLFIWSLRFRMLGATLFASAFYLLALNFPKDTWSLSTKHRKIVYIVTVVVGLMTMTPLVFRSAVQNDLGTLPSPEPGWGMVIFAVCVLWFDLVGLWRIIKNSLHSKERVERVQQRYLLFGFVITLGLILILSFAFPVLLQDTRFINYSVYFTLPFAILTSYAIVRHHLLNIKIISTEITVFALSVITLFELLLADSAKLLLFRGSQFFLVIGFGILLVKSVIREVKQREELEVLSKKLENANVQLKALDQARADFITLTSHQLRTPPATLKWYLSAIKQGDYGNMDEGVREMIVKAEITNNSLISLIEDLLNASRIERGKMEFLFEPTKLDDLTKFTTEQLVPQAGQKHLTLGYENSSEPIPEVLADKEKIRQVINNFIDNAIKYTAKGGIVAWVEHVDDKVKVCVKDTGKGVSREVVPSLFAKYSRGKDAAMQSTGIGIGLYVAKVVIENHNGEIGVESEGEGKGSTFYFTLPVHNNLPHTKVMDLVNEEKGI